MNEQTPQPKTILQIKKEIQSIVSKLMSETQTTITTEDNSIIKQISQYKVSNNLEALSNAFGNVFESSQGSGS